MPKELRSIYGSPYELIFQNGSPDATGDLVGSGIGKPSVRNNWWDTRKMWAYPYYTLSFMTGEGKGFYRDEHGAAYELTPDSFFLTFPDVKHSYGPRKDQVWGEIFVSFKGKIFELARKQDIISPKYPVWKADSLRPWQDRLEKIIRGPIPTNKRQTMQRSTRFLNFLIDLLEESHPLEISKLGVDWFAEACQMLTGNLHDPVDCRQIAANLGMSYQTFRSYFKQRAGLAPMQYREKIRIRQACDYLINNYHKPCREIAFELGFYDADHFTKRFKKHMGTTPGEYRRKNK